MYLQISNVVGYAVGEYTTKSQLLSDLEGDEDDEDDVDSKLVDDRIYDTNEDPEFYEIVTAFVDPR